jgi:MFS family permease
VPTLAQAGYAVGLGLVCPLGDLFPRRPYTLCLVFFTATLWIGLCVTRDFNAFLGITFITSLTTVTPQIMLPLVGEMAPPNKRAFSLSIVVSGNMLGIVLARVLSGIVTQYTSWRNVYLLALGLQYLIFAALWLWMPDYPSSNPSGMNYFRMLWTIVTLCKKHAVLVYAGAVSYCISGAFMNYCMSPFRKPEPVSIRELVWIEQQRQLSGRLNLPILVSWIRCSLCSASLPQIPLTATSWASSFDSGSPSLSPHTFLRSSDLG